MPPQLAELIAVAGIATDDPKQPFIHADARLWKYPHTQAEEHIREGIQKVLSAGIGLERVYFAEKTIQIADRPAVTLVVLSPDQSLQDEKATALFVENMIRENGTSSRTSKSSIIFAQGLGANLDDLGSLVEVSGETVLDRIHQSMILFTAGRSEALRMASVAINGFESSPRHCRRSILRTTKKSAGSMACRRGRKGWAFDE